MVEICLLQISYLNVVERNLMPDPIILGQHCRGGLCNILLDTCCSFSCGIELEDRVVVSGGYEFLDLTSQVVIYTYNIFRYTSSYISTHYLRQVWVYSLTGLVEELPNMIEKRFTHGCGHYVNTDNEPASP